MQATALRRRRAVWRSRGAPWRTGHVTVTAYIAAAPAPARKIMTELRRIVRAAAPDAEEVISYRMPMYKHHGMLVGFAAFAHHVGFYAISTAVTKTHARELVVDGSRPCAPMRYNCWLSSRLLLGS